MEIVCAFFKWSNFINIKLSQTKIIDQLQSDSMIRLGGHAHGIVNKALPKCGGV